MSDLEEIIRLGKRRGRASAFSGQPLVKVKIFAIILAMLETQ